MEAKDRIIRQRKERHRKNTIVLWTVIVCLVVFVIIMFMILVRSGAVEKALNDGVDWIWRTLRLDTEEPVDEAQEASVPVEEIPGTEAWIMAHAEALARQYDYDGAMDLLKGEADYFRNQRYQDAVAGWQLIKDECVPWSATEVTHIYFLPLINDPSRAFDGDFHAESYNQDMATVTEFRRILDEMYQNGYVMVSLHDMCRVNADGSVSTKEILLPEGKKPFVLSQDDVNYYHQMSGDGFADKLVLDEKGRVKASYTAADGTVLTGDYDLVPIVDSFVEEHPDFSWHGHKGVIALTGYEGILGYRTDEVYRTQNDADLTSDQRRFVQTAVNFDWDSEVIHARAVAEAMKAEGWEFASHTWGHINPMARGYERTVTDTQLWLDNVATIIGNTDILIFASGAEIGEWMPYDEDNEYFQYMKEKGFSIFCNVDGSQIYWVQVGDNYLRQSRRNIDGYRMYYNPEMLDDLFEVSKVWDEARPAEVAAR